MTKATYKFSNAATDFYFEGKISGLRTLVDQKNTVLITDENIFKAHEARFRNWNTIVLKPGEDFKVQQTVDTIIDQLIHFKADRHTTLVGIGGGVTTDLTGFVASIYMRGIGFGFVPTTILAMVDASIGGKNGINHSVYKNMVGTIRQPAFIIYDHSLLSSLPPAEWHNGFAEIIKHAAIKDAIMFRELESNTLEAYQKNTGSLKKLVQRNALLKIKLVQQDEFERGERKLLNFGHTLGHALETQYELSHGQAISIGMTYAAEISEQLLDFNDVERLTTLLDNYDLPTYASFNKSKVFEVLRMDKKREKKEINYILLEKVGKGVIQPIALNQLEKIIGEIE